MKLSYTTLSILAENDNEAAEALFKFRFYRSVFPNRGSIYSFYEGESFHVLWLPIFRTMTLSRLGINILPASIK